MIPCNATITFENIKACNIEFKNDSWSGEIIFVLGICDCIHAKKQFATFIETDSTEIDQVTQGSFVKTKRGGLGETAITITDTNQVKLDPSKPSLDFLCSRWFSDKNNIFKNAISPSPHEK